MAELLDYPQLTHGPNLRSWLFVITHRKGIGHLCKRPRESLTDVVSDPGREDDEPHGVTPWAQGGALLNKQRPAVTGRYLDDLPYRNSAKIVESSEAAARQSALAGLATLRQEFT